MKKIFEVELKHRHTFEYKPGNWGYRFPYTDCFGKRTKPCKTGFESEQKAFEAKLRLIQELERYSIDNAITFGRLKILYMERQRMICRSVATIESNERRFAALQEIVPQLDQMNIVEIKRHHADAVIRRLMEVKGDHPSTVADIIKDIKAIFNWAVFKDWLDISPFAKVEKPRVRPKKIPPHSLEELMQDYRLLKRQKHKLLPAFLLAITGGCTKEEVCGLRKTKLNYDDFSILIDEGTIRTSKGNVTKNLKTTSRERTIYFNRAIFEDLMYIQNELGIKSDYVCCNYNGTPIAPNTLIGAWEKFLKDNKLRPVSFHKLRSSFSNVSKRLGTDIDTYMRIAGWSNPKTAMKNYNQGDADLMRKGSVAIFDNIIQIDRKIKEG